MSIETLDDYAAEVFPNHEVDGGSRFVLDHDAIVAHFSDIVRAREVQGEIRAHYPGVEADVVSVHGSARTLTPTRDEDKQGITDLPNRRLGAASAIAAVVAFVVVLVVVLAFANVAAAVISAVFAACLGAWVGFLVGGGARHAGEHAWEQPADVGRRTMGLVAVHARNAQESIEITTLLDDYRPDTVRIVNNAGWRNPSSFAPEHDDPGSV